MIKFFLIILLLVLPQSSFSSEEEPFNIWLSQFKSKVLSEGVSQETVNKTFKNIQYLEKVIKYDRKQPEFFEDTITYVSKRATRSRTLLASRILIKNKKIFEEVEKKFGVEKEILLALWGIETNFGKHVGKMDILSSLATLSFDKRRRDFFSKELIILLKLIDRKLIDVDTLYGSWAGALGNFQFMPSTIKNYAIDYDNNNKIELKTSLEDSLASAANYLNKMGWESNSLCFYEVELTKPISKKYQNHSARKIKNFLSMKDWRKKGIVGFTYSDDNKDYKAALIMPDGDENSPAFLIFKNYEKILKWNRSLRFGISVCTLSTMIKNEI